MGQIVHASINEKGHATGGAKGDQTGKEVTVRQYYYKNWNCVLRHSDSLIGQYAASIGVKLANSNLVGYGQDGRESLRQALISFNWDVDAYIASGNKTHADCSSFVFACYCCVIEGFRQFGYSPTTSSIESRFSEDHGFSKFKGTEYTHSESNLLPGDIINSSTSHHVVMYVGNADTIQTDVIVSNPSIDTPVSVFQYNKKDAILLEIGYLDESSMLPSIFSRDIKLSYINTALFKEIISSVSNQYNYDALPPNAREIVRFLLSKGLNLAASIGVLANIKAESGYEPSANNRNICFGIMQWKGDRARKMKEYTNGRWQNSLSGQLEFAWIELSTGYSGVLSKLLSVPDTVDGAKSAADVFVRDFERPGNIDATSNARQRIAEELWTQCSIISSNSPGADGNIFQDISDDISPGQLQKEVAVPSNVKQSGIIANYTNYSYWYPKWKYVPRKIADYWNSQGRKQNGHAAMIDNCYLVAVAPVFGTTGDRIVIKLDNGKQINAIIADAKGADAASMWGHQLSSGIDIVEWEMVGSSATSIDNLSQSQFKQELKSWGFYKCSVVSIANYGQYRSW